MEAPPPFRVVYALLFILLISQYALSDKVCDADGFCRAPLEGSVCGPSEGESRCADTASLYRSGASAQAYKPHTPFKSQVCDEQLYKSSRTKIASWPFTRSYRQKLSLSVKVTLLSCRAPMTSKDKQKTCCCSHLVSKDVDGTIDVWQARPDGSYSSLRQGIDDGDCRARLKVDKPGSAVFTTVLPGSTGSLGGLGPSRIDFMPYGPPTIHILASVPGHYPVLVNVPVLLNKKTLQQRRFLGPDWRGASWVKDSSKEPLYAITSWNGNSKNQRVDVEMSIYMPQLPANRANYTLEAALCPSLVYGLPRSFFLEPMALCAPSLLNYFAV